MIRWALLFFPFFLTADAHVVLKRVQAHLLVNDPYSAYDEVKEGLKEYPESSALLEMNLKVLATLGSEREMAQALKDYSGTDRELLESLAWGIIHKGAQSLSPNIRITALLGAFFSQDARGVMQLAQFMRDQNSLVRAAACQLASQMRDVRLQEEVLRLFRYDHNFRVHSEAIKAVGRMKISEAKSDLVAIVGSRWVSDEEKAIAIESLVHLIDTAEREETAFLAKSDRAGLRHLACQIIEHFELTRDLDLVFPLLEDYSADVRLAALHVLGSLRIERERLPLALPLLNDPDPLVALTAAWVLTLHEEERGLEAFVKWLKHPNLDISRKAAGALVATGRYGKALLLEEFHLAKDPFIRLNLAIGLLHLNEENESACKALYEGLASNHGRLMWQEHPYFRVLVPSKVKHDDLVPQLPEVTNQLVRLEILNFLAMRKHPLALEGIKVFLKNKQWGITGLASALLLSEGDDTALDLVQELLNETDPLIRVQAALILAEWGHRESAVAVLQEVYEKSPREFKERILEGLGKIGAPASLPFLVEKLQEPQQPLRLIAASALLQCLYH